MEDRLTPILEDLAAGRISADEANRRIDALERPRPAATDETAGQAAAQARDGNTSAPTPGAPGAQGAGSSGVQGAGSSGVQEAGSPGGQDAGTSWADIARDLFGAAGDLAQSAAMGAAAHVGEALGQSGTSRPGAPAEEVDPVTPEQPDGANGVERITIRATARRVRILGDASVATLAADGPHVLRRRGGVLEVTSDGEPGHDVDGFSLLRSPLASQLLGEGLRGNGLDALRRMGLDELRNIGLGKELLLRINPSIPVDVEVTAGSLNTINVPWLGRVRVTAGGAQLGDVRQVADALVQAGSATVRGRFDRGRSRVRVESGNLVVGLDERADVTVAAQAHLGRIGWPGGGADLHEYVAGHGDGRLELAVVMGAATIEDDHAASRGSDQQEQQ